MNTFTWKIESVDTVNSTMIVCYTHNEEDTFLNISFPPPEVELSPWVETFAPKDSWHRATLPPRTDVVAGTTGTATFDVSPMVAVETETVNDLGSWNEEYLRAMIYQVLEEINQNSV